MKKLKIIGLILLVSGILTQIIFYFFVETGPQDLWITPFFWGAVATCLGALLLVIFNLKRFNEKMKLPKECKAPNNQRSEKISEKPPKISEEDKMIRQFHCQLTTPGLWPLE